MYHRVAKESFDPWGLAVDPANFALQVAWLAQNRRVMSLTEFSDLHRTGTLPGDAVAMTFDDGYSCNAEVAAPVLERAGVPATFFVTTGNVGSGTPFWWDQIEELVLSHDGDALSACGQPIELGEKQSGDRNWKPGALPRTPRQAAFQTLWKHLVRESPEAIAAELESLNRQANGPSAVAVHKQPMTRDQVRRVSTSLLSVGSHTLSHPSLPTLGHAEKRHEIAESVRQCEAITGVRPVTFAYPFGHLDAESERMVAEAGFRCACSTDPQPVHSSSPIFALPRIAVGNWRPEGLRAALTLV